MQNKLTEFVAQYGISGVLEILALISFDKSTEYTTTDKKLERKYYKAGVHLNQLSKQKFIHGL